MVLLTSEYLDLAYEAIEQVVMQLPISSRAGIFAALSSCIPVPHNKQGWQQ